jgi:hypothetical protein
MPSVSSEDLSEQIENNSPSRVAVSRSTIDDMLHILMHVHLLEHFACGELVTPEVLSIVRAASTDSFGHDLLHTMELEVHVGSPLTLAQLGRFTHIRHLCLDYSSEVPAPSEGGDLAVLAGWKMPLLESLEWIAEPYRDGIIGKWLRFLARGEFPASQSVFWGLYPMEPDDAAHAAAFFQAHPNIEQLRMTTERYGTEDLIPYIAVRRLYLSESDEDAYAGLGPLIHPAVSQLVLETSPEEHKDLDALLKAIEDAPPAGLRTIILRFRGDPEYQFFSWVDPDLESPEKQTQTRLFRADMIPHVQKLHDMYINLVDELGCSIVGQQVVTFQDIKHMVDWQCVGLNSCVRNAVIPTTDLDPTSSPHIFILS